MPTRRLVAAALGLSVWPGLALANADPAPSPEESIVVDADRTGGHRLTVPVLIGETGPFEFIVDCGADRSVLADDVAAALALPAGRGVMVHGITGAEAMTTVSAPSLTMGGLRLRGGDLPVLPRDRIGADGLLGVDALSGRRLVIDFRNGELAVKPSGGAEYESAARSREAMVAAKARFGALTIVDARAARRRVNVFIDSGGAVTIVNEAMAAAVRARGDWREAAPLARLAGVTSHVAYGEVRVLRRLDIGALSFDDLPVIVNDLHVFDRWGLKDEPTILLGANALRLFSRVELDYRHRRILFRAESPEGWLA